MVDMVHFCFHNIILVQDEHDTMVVPMRKRSRTVVYSGETRPEGTHGTSHMNCSVCNLMCIKTLYKIY